MDLGYIFINPIFKDESKYGEKTKTNLPRDVYKVVEVIAQ